MRGRDKMTAFVPNGESRKETAVLLVGTADEYGIDQRNIVAVNGGFNISDELADLLDQYAAEPDQDETEVEVEVEVEVEAEVDKKTSGNRAAKNASTTGTDKE